MYKLLSVSFLVSALFLSLAACQKAATDEEVTESDFFSLIEEGEEGYSAASYQAFDAGRFRGKRHIRRYIWNLRKNDPTLRAVIGMGIRDPQRDEETEQECHTAIALTSNYQLKVQREPQRFAESDPAVVSGDGKTITIDRDTPGAKLLLSLHDDGSTTGEMTLNLEGDITCGGVAQAVDADLSEKLASTAPYRFRIFEQFGEVFLRGLGARFPEDGSGDETEAP